MIKNAVGIVNGVNLIFETPVPYKPGSLAVFLNGQVKVPTRDDGFVERGGTEFEMKEAPQVGDVLQVMFTAVS